MRNFRPLLASLTAPIAAFLPLLALSIYETNTPALILNGEVDDAPLRAVGLLWVSLPVLYVFFAVISFFLGPALVRLGCITLRRFLIGSASLAVTLAIPFAALSSIHQHDWQEAVLVLAAFAGLFLFMAIPGAMCWWHIAKLQRLSHNFE